MGYSLRQSATGTGSSPVSATLSSAAKAGNLLTATCGVSSGRTFTAPSGWTVLNASVNAGASGTGAGIATFGFIAAGGETAISSAFTGAAATADMILCEWWGAPASIVLDGTAGTGNNGTTGGTSATTPAITTASIGSLIIVGFAQHAAAFNNVPTNGFVRTAIGPSPFVEQFHLLTAGPVTAIDCFESWASTAVYIDQITGITCRPVPPRSIRGAGQAINRASGW